MAADQHSDSYLGKLFSESLENLLKSQLEKTDRDVKQALTIAPDRDRVARIAADYVAMLKLSAALRFPDNIRKDVVSAAANGVFSPLFLLYRREALAAINSETAPDNQDAPKNLKRLERIIDLLNFEIGAGDSMPTRDGYSTKREGYSAKSVSSQLPSPVNLSPANKRYISARFCVPDKDYAGFSAEQGAKALNWGDERSFSGILVSKRKQGIVIPLVRKESRVYFYDFRGIAYHFIKTRYSKGFQEAAHTLFYEPEEARRIVRGVLTLEGVKKEMIEKDAREVLKSLLDDKANPLKDSRGKYSGSRMREGFEQACVAYYRARC